ncbi:universal stress protein [Mesorhizobium sp.]|uniref:universal stress protein n=1 Tax=Mesorhizobium sp. TaxID=1871066 RepID=UPI000FE57309|nr:universal stress protein [Mesorhizobium sp.]RWD37798.1 MAG: universal stress protein [Mesorhizobium sp.]RWD78322.1 MAG: universal stress protein [Mesorhizobium sp.]RWE68466.1 MAG: universal stress protein [Mesorhizobium sp.]RWF02396.1 MAG: universal stress protein [Mesorhizobium sp.]TIS41898.1 MAG: universal stress protein [Mesorhizobium sp.]
MIKSILVALDGSSSSIAGASFALRLASRLQANVEGLGIVNSNWIQRPQPVPIGGLAYRRALDLKLMSSADERIDAVLHAFGSDARRAGITFSAKRIDADAISSIGIESIERDLVVVGRNSLFDVEAELDRIPLCVDRIVRNGLRPVVTVPDADEGRRAESDTAPLLVAFDGSAAASRTLHMLALLGIAAEREVHILTQDNRSEQYAAAEAERACALLRRHGVARVKGVGLGDRQAGTAAEAILGTAKVLGAGMIAMGAYGHSGIREIFGSCTRAVLTEARQPLFLYH